MRKRCEIINDDNIQYVDVKHKIRPHVVQQPLVVCKLELKHLDSIRVDVDSSVRVGEDSKLNVINEVLYTWCQLISMQDQYVHRKPSTRVG